MVRTKNLSVLGQKKGSFEWINPGANGVKGRMVATHNTVETDDETASCPRPFLQRRQERWNDWRGAELARRTGMESRSDAEQVWTNRAVAEPQVFLGHGGWRFPHADSALGAQSWRIRVHNFIVFGDEYKPGGVTKSVPPPKKNTERFFMPLLTPGTSAGGNIEALFFGVAFTQWIADGRTQRTLVPQQE
jgi:hypothetical protein